MKLQEQDVFIFPEQGIRIYDQLSQISFRWIYLVFPKRDHHLDVCETCIKLEQNLKKILV